MQNIKDFEAMTKLDLPDAERQQISQWADMLLDDFSVFSSIDTDGTDPLYTVLEMTNVLREDVSSAMLTRKELLSGAPMQDAGYFQVPRTL